MKNKNYSFIFVFILIAFILIPSNISFAEETSISDIQTALGGEEYATIRDNTIILQQDITLTNEINFIQSSIILDLNGYKIKNTTSSVQPIFTITNSTITIKDSSVSKSGGLIDISSAISELITLNSGSLHIQNGYFQSNEKGINATGGKLIINNATFITNNRCVLTSDNSTLNINNGTFTSKSSNALDISGTTSTINAGTFNGNFSGLEVSNGTVNINSGVFTGDRSVVITGGNVTINKGIFIGNPKSSESTGLYINDGFLNINDGVFKGSAAGLYIDNNPSVSISGGTYNCTGTANIFGGIALYQGAKANISSVNGMKYNKVNNRKNILSLLAKGYSLNNNSLSQKEVDLYELNEMGANGVTLKDNEYYLGYYSVSKPYVKVIQTSPQDNNTNTSDSNSTDKLDDSPKTKDNITLYIISLLTSLIGLCVLYQVQRNM